MKINHAPINQLQIIRSINMSTIFLIATYDNEAILSILLIYFH